MSGTGNLYSLPATDNEALNLIRQCATDEIRWSAAIGYYELGRLLGEDILTAYRKTLEQIAGVHSQEN